MDGVDKVNVIYHCWNATELYLGSFLHLKRESTPFSKVNILRKIKKICHEKKFLLTVLNSWEKMGGQ
jgi:uncharacterized membrane protein